MCKIEDLGEFASELPVRVWDAVTGLVVAHPWRLAAALVAVTVAYVAARVVYLRRWSALAQARGAYMRIIPPRTVTVDGADHVWTTLSGIAARSWTWWRPIRLPLAFEIHTSGDGAVSVGLWRPGWVPAKAVATAVGKAWPGARVEEAEPPAPHLQDRWYGWWLAPSDPTAGDLGALVEPPSMRAWRREHTSDPYADPLSNLLSDLARAGRPACVQALVRPAPAARVRRQRITATRPTKRSAPLRARFFDGIFGGALAVMRALLDLFTPGPSSPDYGHHPPAGRDTLRDDPEAQERMRLAREKRKGGSFLLAALRVAAADGATAQEMAASYGTISWRLAVRRLRLAAFAVTCRYVPRRQWMLVTAGELGVLAHLPADPALHGIDTAARHRAAPPAALPAPPEDGDNADLHGWPRSVAGPARTGCHANGAATTTSPPATRPTHPAATTPTRQAARPATRTSTGTSTHPTTGRNHETRSRS